MTYPKLMPDWEVDLRSTFRNRITVHQYERNVVTLHQALEKATGEKYTPVEKTLYDKMLYVLKLHDAGSDWDSKTMQRHLFFFHQKNFNRSHIGRCLKKIAASGILKETTKGQYTKVGWKQRARNESISSSRSRL